MPTRIAADDPSDMVLDKSPPDYARRPAGEAGLARFTLLVTVVVLLFAARLLPAGEPSGEANYALHITLAPGWFDPGEAPAASIPYLVLYLIHDALVKPMPGQPMAPSLAERWSESPDGLIYEFMLRQGVTYHNGDPFTADDVKFSFERYRGSAAKYLHGRVKAVEIVDPHRAGFFSMRREHALKGIILGSPGMSGNAATWLDGYAMSWGTRQWGGDAGLDDLFRRQAGERDRAEREAVLHEIQRRIHDRVMLAPLLQFAWLVGVARRIDEPALGLIRTFPYSAPYEDIRLSTR